PDAGAAGCAVHALPLTSGQPVRRAHAGRAAQSVRRPRREESEVTIVIFGGAGDLAHRKLLPALYNLHVDGLLPPRIAIVGVGRRPTTDEAFRTFARDGVEKFSRRPIDAHAWDAFAAALFFGVADLDAAEGLAPLGARRDIVQHERGRYGARVAYPENATR